MPTEGATPDDKPICEVVLKNSVVKGYHVYKLKPLMTNPATRLVVQREYSNPRDPSACLVWVPPLSDMPEDIHDMYTDIKCFLKVSDIADLPVGHVPLGFSGSFRAFLEKGCAITCEPIGLPCPSFPPWPQVQEKGGGAVIPCDYFIQCTSNLVEYVKKELKSAVGKMKEKDAMSIQ